MNSQDGYSIGKRSIDLRGAGGIARGALGNTAALLAVPEFVGLAVRAASDRGWDDRGEKSKGDEKARDESHSEMRGVGKRANKAKLAEGPLLRPLAL